MQLNYIQNLQVNPDPYLRADPEIDIMKEEDDDIANGSAFYDEEALGESLNKILTSLHFQLNYNLLNVHFLFSQEGGEVEEENCLEKTCQHVHKKKVTLSSFI